MYGRLEIDNNISERTLKEFVLGRKNYLFFGSPDAAKYSAIIMSMLSSARRHGLNEWELPQDIASLRVCLYAGSWQLVKYCGKRVKCLDAAVFKCTDE